MSGAANDHPLDRLSPYLDDELAVEERARVDRHLASCAGCREHLEALRRLSEAMAREPVPAPPDGFEGTVLRRLDAAAVVPFRRRFMVPASIAATVAAVGLLLVVAWRQGGPRVVSSPGRAPDRASGSVAGGTPTAEKDVASPQRNSTQAAAPAPPPVAPAVTPEPPTPVDEPAASKSKHDEAVSDEVAAQRVTPQQRDAAGAAVANEPMAPVAAKTTASVTGMSRAPAFEAPPRGRANGPVDACAAGVVNSEIEAAWDVADPGDAARSLALLASVHGGRVEPQADGRVDRITVVIPAGRFVAFAGAASSIGVAGFDGAASPARAGCVRQVIRLATAAPR
jgi:hypothetical protein